MTKSHMEMQNNDKIKKYWNRQLLIYSCIIFFFWLFYLLVMYILAGCAYEKANQPQNETMCTSRFDDFGGYCFIRDDIREIGVDVDFSSDSEESKTFWGDKGVFGDMFGALTCLFTGLGIAGLYVTIRMQGEELAELKQQAKDNASQSEKTAINEAINLLVKTKAELACNVDGCPNILDEQKIIRGTAVAELLLHKTYRILCEFHHYSEDANPEDAVKREFGDYIECLSSYIQVSSQVYYILREVDKSINLSIADKNTIVQYVKFNLTPTDSKLLNIIFLRFEYAENLTAYTPEPFSWQNAYHVLKELSSIPNPHIQNIGDKGIRYFMSSMQACSPCKEAQREIDANGNPVTKIITPL